MPSVTDGRTRRSSAVIIHLSAGDVGKLHHTSVSDTDRDLEPLVDALADLRARAARLVLARQERRKEGATAGERMSTSQHVTLRALEGGPLAISELGAATGVAVSTATRMVQALEREGWV